MVHLPEAAGAHARTDEELVNTGLGPRLAVLGAEGDRLGSFRSPCGMAVDSKHIYIADTLNHRIQVFDRARRALLGQVALPPGSGIDLQDPSGVCCAGDGRILVVQYGLDRVLNLQLSAGSLEAVRVETLAAERQLYGPFGVGFAQGRVVVADSCNHRCVMLGAQGQTLCEFGGQGSAPGQFEYPECVATFSDGHVAVSDKDNHRIQVFDPQGRFCHYIPADWQPRGADGQEGEGGRVPPGTLHGPMGLVADRRDRLYVCDCGSDRIQIFTRQGRWLWSSDSAKHGARYEFSSPTGMAMDEAGTIYVVSDHCVQIF